MAFVADFLVRFPEFGPATIGAQTAAGVPPIQLAAFLSDAALEMGSKAWGAQAVPPLAWTLSAVYALGTIVSSVPGNGLAYQCTVAGTSGTTQPRFPTGPTALNATVDDGGVTWTCIGARPLSKADTGQMWLAAHKLACSPFGQQGKLQMRPSQAKDRLLSQYGRTTYGQEYFNMLRSVAAGFRVP